MWWFLSFYRDYNTPMIKFIGSVIIEGDSMPNALNNAINAGINPGGAVQGRTYEEDELPPETYRDRWLTPQEAIAAGAMVEKHLITKGGGRTDN